ncbi:MAG: DUF4416 family protein [Spirochaetes bacterium]|nr:DUF4416 family protein [Spirochaetota bacterium]
MSQPTIPVKSKLFIGILTASEDNLWLAEKYIIKKFGAVDYKTTNIPFIHTKYYNAIGNELFKVILSFKKLIKRENIAEIKLFTNKLENKISGNNKRKINIDPGYLTLSNVFLASCKDYFHRIYLKKGVYVENELKFVNKRYEAWEWTYPDYLKQEYLEFFYNIRKIYYKQIKNKL